MLAEQLKDPDLAKYYHDFTLYPTLKIFVPQTNLEYFIPTLRNGTRGALRCHHNNKKTVDPKVSRAERALAEDSSYYSHEARSRRTHAWRRTSKRISTWRQWECRYTTPQFTLTYVYSLISWLHRSSWCRPLHTNTSIKVLLVRLS